jgi:hypothetical protein
VRPFFTPERLEPATDMPRSLHRGLHGPFQWGDYALIIRAGVWSFGTERAIKNEREPPSLACEIRLCMVIEKALPKN